ncbi:DUF1648 domain-containing protein [Rhodococcus sp. IEGM 1408]|uniref:DUF1648 domain-containing protein n=1 Tax=Rhodococcus sp. IEGM 1408 TaxID=3082220 RepID=UPI002955DEFD|nr:DUF1648 domain-containing protein [Rhodococcus sp. IEGM 1408]MDV8001653.1 DUF1648 domain-containing protein [Rhodococcus sp. IEGM 1408]
MTTTRSLGEEARGLPREPTARWILVLVAGLVAVWLAVLAWQVQVLPERVPTHFGAGGVPDGWSSKSGAIAFSTLGPLLFALPLPLMSLLVLRWPAGINAPNRQWWTATAPRLRRFERLLREDLWLIAAVMLVMFIGIQVGISEAARTPEGRMPGVWLVGPVTVVFVGTGVVLARMFGSRYAEQPDLG